MEEGEGKGNYRMVGKEGRNQEEGEGGGVIILLSEIEHKKLLKIWIHLCLTYIERRILKNQFYKILILNIKVLTKNCIISLKTLKGIN